MAEILIEPSSLSVSTVSSTSLSLSWTNGDTYSSIQIQRQKAGSSWATIPGVDGLATSYTDGNLEHGTKYYYRVKGWNESGDSSPYSAEANGTTTLPAPSSLTATLINETRIDLAWTNGSTYYDYVYIERSTGGAYSVLTSVAGTASSYSDTSVSPGTTYSYKIRGYNNSLNAKYSDYTSVASATPALTPPVPTGYESVSATEIRLYWNDLSQAEDGYKVYTTSGDVLADTIAAGSTSYLFGGLATGWTYLGVAAYKGATVTAIQHFWGKTVMGPTAPDSVAAVAASSTSMTVTWSDNSTNEDSFTISRSPDDATWADIATVTRNTVSYVDTGLAVNTQYYYRVKATNSDGDSAWSSSGNGTTDDYIEAPTELTVFSSSATEFVLNWLDNSSNETAFSIWEETVGGAAFAEIDTVAADVTTYTRTGRTTNTWYKYKVKAVNATPTSSTFTNIVQIQAIAPPATPTDLAAQAVSSSQINLTWTDASSNEDGFRIEYSLDNLTFYFLANAAANATHYEHQGLTADTTYYYKIRAFKATSSSVFTSSVSDTTLAGPAQTHLLGLVDVVEIVTHQPTNRKDAIGKNTIWTLEEATNTPRECYWRSKDFDFADELGPEVADLVKRVNYVKLFYIDVDEDVPTTLQVSVDGGKTWEIQRAVIGEGDGMTKEYTFDFSPLQNVSGNIITFLIACYDASKQFMWTGAEVDLTIFGSRATSSE